jgi:hypothetical protein
VKKSEVVRLVAMLRARFPKIAGDFSPDHAAAYCEELIDLEYETAYIVARKLSRTEDWFPSIAAVRDAYAREKVGFPDADVLWRQVLHWAHKTAYGRDAMPVPSHVMEMVEFLGGWRELGSKDQTVARAHALKAHTLMRDRALRRVQCGSSKLLSPSRTSKTGSRIGESAPPKLLK